MSTALIEDLFSLAGKTAVVVGGGGVLAGELSMGFAGAGANVVIADLNEDSAKRQAQAICDLGRKGLACQADVSKKADIQRVLDATLANFGGVDILLNAAGINSGTPFFEIEEKEWERILDVDLRSVFLACQVIGKTMVDAGKGGSIINISSTVSSIRGVHSRYAYGASKAAVIGLTKAVAADFVTQGIRCNAICPGTIQSPSLDGRITAVAKNTGQSFEAVREAFIARQPIGRLGTTQEVAVLAVFLASDESSYITGQPHLIDGGMAL
jgi:2-keto-3-deoxy-L-fuconate dehydrogenase